MKQKPKNIHEMTREEMAKQTKETLRFSMVCQIISGICTSAVLVISVIKLLA